MLTWPTWVVRLHLADAAMRAEERANAEAGVDPKRAAELEAEIAAEQAERAMLEAD